MTRILVSQDPIIEELIRADRPAQMQWQERGGDRWARVRFIRIYDSVDIESVRMVTFYSPLDGEQTIPVRNILSIESLPSVYIDSKYVGELLDLELV